MNEAGKKSRVEQQIEENNRTVIIEIHWQTSNTANPDFLRLMALLLTVRQSKLANADEKGGAVTQNEQQTG